MRRDRTQIHRKSSSRPLHGAANDHRKTTRVCTGRYRPRRNVGIDAINDVDVTHADPEFPCDDLSHCRRVALPGNCGSDLGS